MLYGSHKIDRDERRRMRKYQRQRGIDISLSEGKKKAKKRGRKEERKEGRKKGKKKGRKKGKKRGKMVKEKIEGQ